MSLRQALLLSSANCYGYGLLEFARKDICSFLFKNYVQDLVFVPYATNDYTGHTAMMQDALGPWGICVQGLHQHADPVHAIDSSRAIFVGGGNTFLLLTRLYENKLVKLISQRVHEGNLLYIGASAGTNVATKSIHTTNDMPIRYPPSFDGIGIVPFNINPHYIDRIDLPTYTGETRDDRIFEYQEMPYAAPVLALKEGSLLRVKGNSLTIGGVAGGALFVGNDAVFTPETRVESMTAGDLITSDRWVRLDMRRSYATWRLLKLFPCKMYETEETPSTHLRRASHR
ncbi:peptidase family s51 domain-containing protein [Phthorimaea operculella]|nr:peptidase family s51 domain-containing protein [Phthorimaea operculella]